MEDPNNVRLLNEAVDEAMINQNGFRVNYYTQRYLSPAKALELKRSFRVRGFCSADTGPRDHAMGICMLVVAGKFRGLSQKQQLSKVVCG